VPRVAAAPWAARDALLGGAKFPVAGLSASRGARHRYRLQRARLPGPPEPFIAACSLETSPSELTSLLARLCPGSVLNFYPRDAV